MNRLSTYTSIFLLFFSGVTYATSFVADAVQIRGDSVSEARMYWLDGDVRFEYTEDGVPMAQIFDNRNKKVIWLDTKNRYFVEEKMPVDEELHTIKESKKNTDPCKQFIGAECTFLKKAEMNGRAAEKWLITIQDRGHDFHIFQWIDEQYRNILRQENPDGTSLNVFIEDNQKVNERNVRKLTMIAYSAAGERQQGIQWYDNELDIVVKQEYQDGVIDELRNIDVGDISRELFTIPKGYRVYDADLMSQSQVSQADTGNDAGVRTADIAGER